MRGPEPRARRRTRQALSRQGLWAAALLALAALAFWINVPLASQLFDGSAQRVGRLAQAPGWQPGERLLVLAPHPDDETLCCAGMIQQAQAAGAQVWIAWVTAGDGFEFDAALTQRVLRPGPAGMRRLGRRRMDEARRAAALLGVPSQRTFTLGFPDGGLFALYTTHYAHAYQARRTGAQAVYLPGALVPGAPFTGQALEGALREVLNRVRPDAVLVPAPQDFHADHRTLAYLALRLLSERQQAGRLRFWVVHGGLEWPVPKGLHQTLRLTLPPLASRLPWQRIDLSPVQEKRKLRALSAYTSQMRVMGRFLLAFVRQNELLSPAPLP